MATAPRPDHDLASTGVRPCAPHDLAACVALLRETYETDRYPVHWPSDPARWLTAGRVEAAWVAERDGAIAGHLVVKHPGEERLWPQWRALAGGETERIGVVSRFFVARGSRGHGIGSALMDRAHAYATEHGLRLVLEAAEHNLAAMAFYRRRGWREVGGATITLSDGSPLPVRLFVAPARG